MMKALVLSLLAVSVLAAPMPANFYAALAPSGTPPSACMGGCYIQYSTTTMMLTVNCIHNYNTDVTAAHIHGPAAAGATGNPIWTFDNTGKSPLTTYTPTGKLTNEQEGWLFDGLLYVNVHGPAPYAAGACRGQIMADSTDLWAWLDGSQAGTTSTATGLAQLKKGTATNTADITVWQSLTAAAQPVISAAHVHGPAMPGKSAGVMFGICGAAPLTACPNPTTFSVAVVAAADADTTNMNSTKQAWAGMGYVNLHTTASPNGEIRGQLYPLWKLTKPMRASASSLIVGLPVFLISLLAALALKF
jgi:hypothetical protein